MRVVANKRGMEHRNAVIKMVSPYLVSLTELHSCADHSVNADCRWALLSQYSLAMQPLPALEHLVIHVDGAWSLSLPGLLRMTPNLITLGLNGEIDDLVLPLGIEMWPKLVRLTTLSLDTLSESLDTELFYTLVPLCGNLQTVNLKLDSLTWEDEERIMSCLYPVRYAPNVEHMHLDLPWQAEEGIQGWYERLYSEIYEDPTDNNDPHWPALKTLSVKWDVSAALALIPFQWITPAYTPTMPLLETFRMTTSLDPLHSETDVEFGSLPSRTTTGNMTEALLSCIRRLPSLTLFEAGYTASPSPFPPTEPLEMLQSLKIQTFVNGKNVLVHCWTSAECSLFRFGRHDDSYDLPIRHGTTPNVFERSFWTEKACLSEDGSIEHGYDFGPYNLPEHDTGSTGRVGPYEFTHYRGWHLPFVLLDYVYSQIDRERMSSRGERGLELPPHVWQVLDDWRDGVESLLKHRGEPMARF